MIFLKRFRISSQLSSIATGLVIVASLTACGGGGGGGAGNEPANRDAAFAESSTTRNSVEPVATTDPATNPADTDIATASVSEGSAGGLMISEVATNYYSNDVAWFEVYNTSSNAILLSNYKLRSGYFDAAAGITSYEPVSFDLPAVTVPAKSYLVIAGSVYDKLQNNNQIVYVKNGTRTPYWNASGSVELVASERTIDFVRFGSPLAQPLKPDAWASGNVAALPSGPGQHGKSIVRLASRGMSDTNAAADWTLVNFATPAGPNDVGAGVIDSDSDGIPDSAKVLGGTYAGLDLYAMGARPGQRDLFIEVDYMTGSDPGVRPRREALQKVVDAFAEKNIAVHFDAGNLYGATFNPAAFNLGGGNAVPFSTCIELATSSAASKAGCTSFYDFKSRHFDKRRALLFHYALFANSQNLNGSAGSSGIAEIAGNDLIVTLGGYGFSTTSSPNLNLLINLQASTLMHELGHNLGLQHGGNESTNYKPNHYSIMNYMYQFAGLSTTPSSMYAAERYFLANGMKGKTYCNLVENSPCSNSFRISYSEGTGADLNEASLFEASNIGRGSNTGAYADWNDDYVFNAGAYTRNLNPQDGAALTILKDYNEWANLILPFSRHYSGSNSGDTFTLDEKHKHKKHAPRTNPMNLQAREHIVEHPLPIDIHGTLRKLHPNKPESHR